MATSKVYRYGMRLRGPSPGAIPKSMPPIKIIEQNRSTTGFYAILVYRKPLSPEDIEDYDLTDLNQKSKLDYRKMLIDLNRKNKNIARDPAIHQLIKDKKYQEAYNLALIFKGHIEIQTRQSFSAYADRALSRIGHKFKIP